MLNLHFGKLTSPTPEVARVFTRWENDPNLIPLARPNKDQHDLDRRTEITLDELESRLASHQTYLIHLDGELIGEMNFQVDPPHLFRKHIRTAWIGICIGEASARGKGIGVQALQYLEQQIWQQKISRIELGVFEFNTNAIKLYQKLGYLEIGRIQDFTFWQSRMWDDIRMEKVAGLGEGISRE